MPRKGKRSSTSKRGGRRGKVYGAAAAQLWKDVKLIKSAVNVEYKVQDTTQGLTNITTTPVVTLFNGLLRGDDFNQRNGRMVKWTSIYQRITGQSVVTAAVPHYIRYILFWYKDPSGVAPNATQMFGTATPSINAMMNLNVRKDFIILTDMVMRCNPVAGGSSSNFRKIYKKTSMHTVFNGGNAGSIADIESGALYAFTWSDTATAGELPQMTVQSRLRYVDN